MVRVEFRVDGALVNTDTTAPYAFTATGLAAGSHSVTATAVDNGSPALSTTSTAVAFTIGRDRQYRAHGIADCADQWPGVPRQARRA